MANGRLGKAVFEQRVEYPLPKRAGVKDDVVYFVGPGDGYGKSARKFFDGCYRDHVRRSASSLEEMIEFLDSEVANWGDADLVCDVSKTVPADLPVLRDVNARSLAVLQRKFAANDARFASFLARRARVMQRLLAARRPGGQAARRPGGKAARR